MIYLGICLVLLATFGILVAYYVTLKNKRGPFRDTPSCPRCKTPLPKVRYPRSPRQSFSGGWTCPVCGCGVDRRGEEIAPNAPPTIVKSEEEIWKGVRKWILITSPLVLVLNESLEVWGRIVFTHVPFGWDLVLSTVFREAVGTSFCTAILLLFLKSFIMRKSAKSRGSDATLT